MSIRLSDDRWPQDNRRLPEVIGALTDEGLATRPAPDLWPIWATVGHTAAARVHWLCHVVGEPGTERTPFTDPTGDGWEDHLDHPLGAAELVSALDTTWAIIDGVLDRWAALHGRGVPLRRAVPDAGDPRAAADRPLATRLTASFT